MAMKTIAFKAVIKNGAIEVPPEYRFGLGNAVKVILMDECHESSADMIEHLLNNPVQMSYFEALTRDAVYDRSR
jgi:hypothetical protein